MVHEGACAISSLNIMGRMSITTKTTRLPLTTLSTISLFIGMLSSSYIAFLAGQVYIKQKQYHDNNLLNNNTAASSY